MFTNRTSSTPTSQTSRRVTLGARLWVFDFAALLLRVQIDILIVQIAPFGINTSIKVLVYLFVELFVLTTPRSDQFDDSSSWPCLGVFVRILFRPRPPNDLMVESRELQKLRASKLSVPMECVFRYIFN